MGSRPGGFGNDADWPSRPEVRGIGGGAERELAFETPDERLPWLESDDGDEETATYDTGRLVGLGLIMLVVLAVLVGAVWFVANRGSGSGPAPDGSLIAAPEGPYKERPASPGGKIFAGTGDTSYAVGEGQEIEGRLGAAAAPAPVATTPAVAPSATTSGEPSPTPSASAETALPAGTAVQVGAYSSRADAEAGWRRLTGQTEALSGVSYRIFTGRADIGTVHRLQAVGGSRAGAQALCTELKAAGIACQVK